VGVWVSFILIVLSLMTSIEDILAASDSDDEEVKHSINLESLLEEDDDDELTPAPLSIPTPLLSSRSILDDDGTTALSLRNPPLTRLKRPSLGAESLDSPITGSEAASRLTTSDEGGVTEFLTSLEMADAREQRNMMHSAGKEVVSALQAKRGKNGSSTTQSNISSSTTTTDDGSTVGIKYLDMDVLSTQLRRNSSYKQHGPGTATAIFVHKRFFVIGTSSGLLLLFDRNQEIRQVVGSSSPQGSRCHRAVTAIDVLPNGSLILCGYLTGEIAIWDTLKGTTLKRVTDLHSCRITHLRFIVSLNDSPSLTASSFSSSTSSSPSPSPSSSSSSSSSYSSSVAPEATNIPSDFSIVSVDAKGVVNRGRFAKSMWANLSADFDLLLDGQSGIILDMSILQPYRDDFDSRSPPAGAGGRGAENASSFARKGVSDSPPVASPFLANMNFVAFNSLTRTYIVQIQPVVRVIHRWPSPPAASAPTKDATTVATSSLDWAWTVKRQYRWPVLARAWGDSVQILSLDCSASDASQPSSTTTEARFVYTLLAESVLDTTSASASAGGGGRCGGVLSIKWLDNERLVALCASKVLVLNARLEVLEQSKLPSNLSAIIASSVQSKSIDEFLPSAIHVCSSSIYVLSSDALVQIQFQLWTQQADQLIRDGKWLEALATALESCGFWATDGAERSKSGNTFFEERNRVHIERYIKKYVELAVSQPSQSASALLPASSSGSRSHFHLVSGVCIEYCMAAGRSTLLFGELFDSFHNVQQEHVFLEALEPYILSRLVRTLPKHILSHMTGANGAVGGSFPSLERCIAFLDLQGFDNELLAKVLLERRLYSGFLYVHVYGLGDAPAALQLLFKTMSSISKMQQLEVSPGRRASSAILLPLPSPEEAEIGFKVLLFIRFLSEGKIFPRGEACTGSSAAAGANLDFLVASIRFLLNERFQAETQSAATALSCPGASSEWSTHRFPYLSYLVMIDPGAPVYCLSKGLQFLEGRGLNHGDLVHLYTQLFDFAFMIDGETKGSRVLPILTECSASHLCKSSLPLPWEVVRLLIRRGAGAKTHTVGEALMLNLARAQAQHHASPTAQKARDYLEENNFWRAALVIPTNRKADAITLEKFEKALAFYAEVSVAAGTSHAVFDYVDDVFSVFSVDSNVTSELLSSLGRALAKVTLQLVDIQPMRAKAAVSSYLQGHIQDVINATKTNPAVQLDVLSSLIAHVEESEGDSKPLSEAFTDSELQVYVNLLIAFTPARIFPFLSSHSFFKDEKCLAFCREKNIIDASALLLERLGDVTTSLSLLLQEFSRGIQEAKTTIEGALRLREPVVMDLLARQGKAPRAEAVSSLPAFKSLQHAVDCVVGLCFRTSAAGTQGSTQGDFWFKALDHFLEGKRELFYCIYFSSPSP